MSNSFTNLNILDCNRQSSTQAKSNNNSNPALWENKLGSGIKINVGDEIVVSSAFVSEEGAGDENTIEFSGVSFGKEKQLTYLSAEYTEPVSNFFSPSGFAKIEWSSVNASIDMTDNKASIVINYFKSANGENYFQLPRKYMTYAPNIAVNESNLFYAQENSKSQGNASYVGGGLPWHQVPYYDRFPPYNDMYYVQADYYYFSGQVFDGTPNNIGEPFWKLRNDNSRFTIYVAKTNYYVGTEYSASVTNIAPQTYIVNELSQREYLRYSERIDLQVKKGFNSADDIANSLTNQLNATGELKNIAFPNEIEEPYFNPSINISTYLEQPTYKTFISSNVKDLTDVQYKNWDTLGGAGVANTQEIVTYQNQTNFIGIKRPDLYDRGKEVADGLRDKNQSAFFTSPALLNNHANNQEVFTTNIPFTDENLNLLRNLFLEQKNYPELFTNEFNVYGRDRFNGVGTNINNSRFIHLSPSPYIVGNSGAFFNQLGTDDCSGVGSLKDVSQKNLISLPLFFVFDPARENILSGGRTTSLWGGFAVDSPDVSAGETTRYIGLLVGTTNAQCPIPPEYFLNNTGTGTTINVNTRLGWDTHFTAYGTCAIALCDGWIKSQWTTERKQSYWETGVNPVISSVTKILPNASSSQSLVPIDNSRQIKRSYLGANNPLVNFNPISNRFNLSKLHTAEFSGNRADAGGPSVVANFTPVPLNPNANQPVYKINKRNNCVSWTTALLPYTQIDTPAVATLEEGKPANFLLELPNYNLDKYKIFDSQSGIIIKDFGFDEENWDRGLWGILGFTYIQFNSERDSTNDITERLTGKNKQTLPYAFTNALVSASDTIDFNVNGWGAPAYNSMLPLSFVWNGSGSSATDPHSGKRINLKQENPPPITKEQISVELTATNLPKRMMRPYYCIRSDIVNESHYIGGGESGQLLPVVGIVNKENGYGDYYFSNESPFIFTATKSRMLTSITTSIHYPNQEFALVNETSGVIYKITHQQPAVSNVVEELFKEKVFTKKDLEKL